MLGAGKDFSRTSPTSLYREGNWGHPRLNDLPKAPKGFDSGPRSEHGTEIHAETEFGNTHYFSLCQKFSCFHKHYTHMMIFSNSSWTKTAYMFYKRYARISGHMHTMPNIWMKNKKSVRITFAKSSSIDFWLPLCIQCMSPGARAWDTSVTCTICTAPSSSFRAEQPCLGLWFWHLHQGQGEELLPIPPLCPFVHQ